MWPDQPMVFNYRKLYRPSTDAIYIGLHHLLHEGKQTLLINLQNVVKSFKLSRHSLLSCAKS